MTKPINPHESPYANSSAPTANSSELRARKVSAEPSGTSVDAQWVAKKSKIPRHKEKEIFETPILVCCLCMTTAIFALNYFQKNR